MRGTLMRPAIPSGYASALLSELAVLFLLLAGARPALDLWSK